MTRTLDKKEKKLVRIKINNVLDQQCGICPINVIKDSSQRLAECKKCSVFKEMQDLSQLLESKPKHVEKKREIDHMSALNGLTVEKYKELNAAGKSNSEIEREFDIKLGTLSWHMKKQFNYVLPKKNKPKTMKPKKKQVKQPEKQHQGLTIEVIEPVEPTISLTEYQNTKVQLNEALFEIHSLREEMKELEYRNKTLELWYNSEKKVVKDQNEYAGYLKIQLEEACQKIEKQQLEILELQEDNMELSVCLKRRLV